MITFSLKVIELRKETADTVTICFKQPLLKKVKYKAGQYLSVIINVNGRRYIRPYSFSSAPSVDNNIEVTVKRVPGGVVSNHLCDIVKVGDTIVVMEPMGDFIIDESFLATKKHFILWGAGSGITPLFSIAKYLLSLDQTHHITLVYGNRSYESVIFSDKIRLLEISYPQNFSVWHFHTQLVVEEGNPSVIQGRIAPEKVLSVMNSEGTIHKSYHYICGPVGLKESVKASLFRLQIPTQNIFSEDFELVKNEKDFEKIISRKVRLILDGQKNEVEVVKGKSILEAGLDSLLNLNYSCQTGNCSVCKGKVLKGQVKHIGLTKEPEALMENEFLLCCSYPISDDVEIVV